MVKSLFVLTDPPNTFYDVLGLEVQPEHPDWHEKYKSFLQNPQKKVTVIRDHPYATLLGSTPSFPQDEVRASDGVGESSEEDDSSEAEYEENFPACLIPPGGCWKVCSEVEIFMRKIMPLFPCRALYSKAEIIDAATKKLLGHPRLKQYVDEEFIKADVKKYSSFFEGNRSFPEHALWYIYSTNMSVEDLKFVEEVMAAKEHLLVANIQYDHELRRAVGPEGERSVTRRRILEYRARKLKSPGDYNFIYRWQALRVMAVPADTDAYWEERKYILRRLLKCIGAPFFLRRHGLKKEDYDELMEMQRESFDRKYFHRYLSQLKAERIRDIAALRTTGTTVGRETTDIEASERLYHLEGELAMVEERLRLYEQLIVTGKSSIKVLAQRQQTLDSQWPEPTLSKWLYYSGQFEHASLAVCPVMFHVRKAEVEADLRRLQKIFAKTEKNKQEIIETRIADLQEWLRLFATMTAENASIYERQAVCTALNDRREEAEEFNVQRL